MIRKTNLLAPAAILWELLEQYGHDPETVFSKEGITRTMIQKPGARTTQTVGDNLWVKASELIDDPCFGLKAGALWHPSHLNALGYAWLASATLRESLNRLVRYYQILTKGVNLWTEASGGGLGIYIEYHPELIYVPARTDQFFAILMSMCRVNSGSDLNPVSVDFIHPEPSCSGEYFGYFKAPVSFNAKQNCLVLPLSKLDAPLQGYNPELARMNDQVILRYLAGLDKEDIVERVKSAIIGMLASGGVSDDKVAQTLGMSARSLQRSLRKAETTFGKLLDEVRRDLAKDYVRDPGMSLTEVAFVLGFSEHSAFSRAFRRWTGTSPSDMRNAANP